jgi:hypothetical protein
LIHIYLAAENGSTPEVTLACISSGSAAKMAGDLRSETTLVRAVSLCKEMAGQFYSIFRDMIRMMLFMWG